MKKNLPFKAEPESDKAHFFQNVYRRYLGGWQERHCNLLELGVLEGASLLMWERRFPRWNVVGIDQSRCTALPENLKGNIYVGDQANIKLLNMVGELEAPLGFDVIVDDAAHIGKKAETSFWHLFFNHLRPGGLYFIEDWGTGYWDDWPDGSSGKARNSGMVKFVKTLVDEQGAVDSTRKKSTDPVQRASVFEFVHFYPSVVVVKKSTLSG